MLRYEKLASRFQNPDRNFSRGGALFVDFVGVIIRNGELAICFALFPFGLAGDVISRRSMRVNDTFRMRPKIMNPGGMMLASKICADQNVFVSVQKSTQRMSATLSTARADGFHHDGWQEQLRDGVFAARNE